MISILPSWGKAKNVVIPRHAACRGISLFLGINQREIPRSPWRPTNDTLAYFLFKLLGRDPRVLRLRACFALLVLVALVVSAPAQDKSYPLAASVLQPQAYVSIQPVPRGRLFEI